MSAQPLSPRSVRRIARSIGRPVLRGWSHGGYWLSFVTPDHEHGVWHRRTGEWTLEPDALCYTSCAETWGAEDTARLAAARRLRAATMPRVQVFPPFVATPPNPPLEDPCTAPPLPSQP